MTIRPGDLIFGDFAGVVCIPRGIACEVLLRAEKIERNELDGCSWIHLGDTIAEILGKSGSLFA